MKPTGATRKSKVTAANLSRPLPWSSVQRRSQIDIYDAQGFPVGQFYDQDAAEYALRAANEREQLREALRQLITSAEFSLTTPGMIRGRDPLKNSIESANAVLGDQKGEGQS